MRRVFSNPPLLSTSSQPTDQRFSAGNVRAVFRQVTSFPRSGVSWWHLGAFRRNAVSRRSVVFFRPDDAERTPAETVLAISPSTWIVRSRGSRGLQCATKRTITRCGGAYRHLKHRSNTASFGFKSGPLSANRQRSTCVPPGSSSRRASVRTWSAWAGRSVRCERVLG